MLLVVPWFPLILFSNILLLQTRSKFKQNFIIACGAKVNSQSGKLRTKNRVCEFDDNPIQLFETAIQFEFYSRI